MSYAINSLEDLDAYSLDELEAFLKADKVNADRGRDMIVNPSLGLELIYEPTGYVCNGA